MYYFITILCTLTTVSPLSLEIDESVAIAFGLNKDANATYHSGNVEHNSDADKAALISLRRDLMDPKVRRTEHDNSIWYPVKSYGPAGKLSIADESLSSDGVMESNSDEYHKTSIARTPKRTHKAPYKAPKVYSSWTKKYVKRSNRMQKTRYRNKRNHIQKKKSSKNIMKNKKQGAVGLYIDNMRQILYNETHYSIYSEPLQGTYDISDLWRKQHFVKPFDETFKVPLPSNRLRDKTSRIPHRDKKKNISSLRQKNKLHNVPYVKKDKADHVNKDANLRKKTVDELKYGDVYNLINYYLNTLELSKINVKPGTGRSDIAITFPENWLENLKNISKDVAHGVENLWQDQLKPTMMDAITIKPIELFVTMKPVEIFHEIGDKAVSAATGAENLWQHEVKPNFIDKIKDVFVPSESQNTTVHLRTVQVPTVPVTENVIQAIVNETSDLWQPWIHRVRDDVKINSFIKHILTRNLKIFDIIEQISNDENWKTYIRYLARSYEDKFNEFITETSQHKIKSRIGSERVVLNAIDVSDHIITRLFNFAIDEIIKNGFFKQNTDIPNMIIAKINEETNTTLERACSQLNICRHKSGFVDFIGDIFTKISSLQGKKFEQAATAFTAAVKNTDVRESLGSNINKGLHKKASIIDKLPHEVKKGAFGVLTNIIVNRNSPLVIYGDGKVGVTYKTIAMLDILKILDENVPAKPENVKQWNTIKADMQSYVENRTENIVNTMFSFVKHMKKGIDGINKLAKVRLRDRIERFEID